MIDFYDLHQVESFIFNGGEVQVKERTTVSGNNTQPFHIEIAITAILRSSDDVINLLMVTDAIRRYHKKMECIFHVYLPYLPYARQDREMVYGEALSIKVFCNLINSLNYKTVQVLDPHSDVGPALLNGCITKPNHDFVTEAIDCIQVANQNKLTDLSIVSPDAGSNKKIKDLLEHLHIKHKNRYQQKLDFNLVKCDKTRDVKTGKLTGFEVYKEDLTGQTCVIIDDICDGGGTFLGLATELKAKGAAKIYLVVTHGIFSKGTKILNEVFDGVFTTRSFYKVDAYSETDAANERIDEAIIVGKLN
jgi:ribose-phosphate pyrophosphokinase